VTEVRKIWAGITAGAIVLCGIMAAWVCLFPHGLGGAIALGLTTGLPLGSGAGFGVFALCEALSDAQDTDIYNRDKKLAEVKAEFERMMREEERKSRG